MDNRKQVLENQYIMKNSIEMPKGTYVWLKEDLEEELPRVKAEIVSYSKRTKTYIVDIEDIGICEVHVDQIEFN